MVCTCGVMGATMVGEDSDDIPSYTSGDTSEEERFARYL